MASKTKTRKAVTSHGEVEYETVICDSCGNEAKKDDARRFVIGDPKSRTEYASHTTYRFNDGEYADGWACQFCYDETTSRDGSLAPVSFPQQNDVRDRIPASIGRSVMRIPLAVAVALVIRPPGLVLSEVERQTDISNADRDFLGFVVHMIWVVCLLLFVLLGLPVLLS